MQELKGYHDGAIVMRASGLPDMKKSRKEVRLRALSPRVQHNANDGLQH
jgi:hypothetical protein